MVRTKQQAEYRKTLSTARTHLRKLYKDRDELEREIARLRQTVITLGTLCGEDPQKEYLKGTSHYYKTLTDAVLSTVVTSDKPVRTTEIRDVLADIGYVMPSSNPLASIHSVLKRLWQQKAISVAYKRGRNGRWRGQPVDLGERFYWYSGPNSAKPTKSWILIKDWAYRLSEAEGAKGKKE